MLQYLLPATPLQRHVTKSKFLSIRTLTGFERETNKHSHSNTASLQSFVVQVMSEMNTNQFVRTYHRFTSRIEAVTAS